MIIFYHESTIVEISGKVECLLEHYLVLDSLLSLLLVSVALARLRDKELAMPIFVKCSDHKSALISIPQFLYF